MQFELSDEQLLFQSSLETLLGKYRQLPGSGTEYVHYSQELQQELGDSGYLTMALQEGFSLLDAALMIESVARLPYSVEVAASVLTPFALGRALPGPVALCEGVGKPTRFLPQARHACVLTADGVRLAEIGEGESRCIESVVAYPLGVLESLPVRNELLGSEVAAALRSSWWLAIAAEGAGLMRAALDLTVAYVRERRQFNQRLGDFQAIQHRLSAAEQIVAASYLLTMRAAHSQRAEDAATAALYVQQQMRNIVYDCHQFTGAMGLTLEYPLHLWTYRLKLLQGELGGVASQAAALAELKWPGNPQARAAHASNVTWS